jgi:exopolyphosphatase/guanosine-5'-triphosphate,3'-diphosphate pyrophosphatase
LIGQIARFHRKGRPGLGEFAPLARKGDEALLARCAAAVRVAEQLERPRDQTVQHAHVKLRDGRVELRLQSSDDATISRWGAQRQADLFKRAFGKELTVTD